MENQANNTQAPTAPAPEATKFCQHCGGKIPKDAVLCTLCGRQVEKFETATQAANPQIVINNANSNVNQNVNNNFNPAVMRRAKNKWVAVVLCLLLGVVGGHKFYEGKIGMGILYLFTGGLFCIGMIVDLIVLLTKPNPYYV